MYSDRGSTYIHTYAVVAAAGVQSNPGFDQPRPLIKARARSPSSVRGVPAMIDINGSVVVHCTLKVYLGLWYTEWNRKCMYVYFVWLAGWTELS